MSNQTFDQSSCEKHFLNPMNADVLFVFGTDPKNETRIRAHKWILAASSSVFKAKFDESTVEKVVIPITNTCPEVFTEFLQLFYKKKALITIKNYAEVARLCKEYVMDGLEARMKQSLNYDNVFHYYTKAMLLEFTDLIRCCEQQIKINAQQICSHGRFMRIPPSWFHKVLQLMLLSPDCNAQKIIDSCMVWAEVQCERKKLDVTPQNMRNELEDRIDRMPFDQLTLFDYMEFNEKYKGFLNDVDIQRIAGKVVLNKFPKNVNKEKFY